MSARPAAPKRGLPPLSPAVRQIADGIKAAAPLLQLEGQAQRWTFGPATMPGQLCSKSNSRQIVKFGNRTALIKNPEARGYVQTFIRLFRNASRIPFTGPVRLIAAVYYQDRRRDLDVALLQDCLQVGSVKNLGAGIIENDRQVIEIMAGRFIDKENPRTVFMIEEILQGEISKTIDSFPKGTFKSVFD